MTPLLMCPVHKVGLVSGNMAKGGPVVYGLHGERRVIGAKVLRVCPRCDYQEWEPYQDESPMPIKELHTFTDAEMEVIADALKIANAHYRTLAEVSHTRYASEFRQEFERQAEEASALQLKIEASK